MEEGVKGLLTWQTLAAFPALMLKRFFTLFARARPQTFLFCAVGSRFPTAGVDFMSWKKNFLRAD